MSVVIDLYKKALRDAIELHSKMQDRIDITVKDEKLAIYLLQGGAITQALQALRGWESGDLNRVYCAKRFIGESMELSFWFAVASEPKKSQIIERWFSGQIMGLPKWDDPKNIKLKKSLLEHMGWQEEHFAKWLSTKKSLFSAFSKGPHPSFEAVVCNATRNTFEFDYKCENLRLYPIDNFDFGLYVVNPVLQIILMHARIVSVLPDEFVKIKKHIDDFSKAAFE